MYVIKMLPPTRVKCVSCGEAKSVYQYMNCAACSAAICDNCVVNNKCPICHTWWGDALYTCLKCGTPTAYRCEVCWYPYCKECMTGCETCQTMMCSECANGGVHVHSKE